VQEAIKVGWNAPVSRRSSWPGIPDDGRANRRRQLCHDDTSLDGLISRLIASHS
jgi:hypothetical protein